MAHLGQKTTSGELAWDKYVKKNKNWEELNLEAEIDSILFKKSGLKLSTILEFGEGENIKIKSTTLVTIGNKKYAQVTIKNKSGYVSISSIRKPTKFKPTGYEEEVVNIINEVISKNNNAPIDIKIKGDTKTYKGICGAIQVNSEIKRQGRISADPKADIILYTDKDDLLNSKNIFISHKKEGGPEAFQQYGGLTEKSGKEIYEHPETKKFLKMVSKNVDPKNGLNNPMFMKVKDDNLKNMSIYGPDYNKKYGLQHVQIIGQGLPKLTPTRKDGVYELSFTSHMSMSGDLSHFIGGYTPVFAATFRAGRGFDLDNKRYDGVRVGIYPMKLVETRGGVVEIK